MRKIKLVKKMLSIMLSVTVFASTFNVNVFAKEDGTNIGENIRTKGLSGWDGVTTEHLYEGDNYNVTFTLNEYWNGGYNVSVKVNNTSDEVIHNWYLAYNENYDIVNIWNAEVHENIDGLSIFKNVGWNQDILPGSFVELGFTGKGEFCGFPTKYEIKTNNIEVDIENYSIDYVVNSDWGSGFTANVVITNNSVEIIEDWSFEFDFGRTINSIWNGEIETCKENHYVISNAGYNSNIEPGQSVSFGFLGGSGSREEQLKNCKLYEYDIYSIEYIELADGKIDKRYIENAIYPQLIRDGLSIENIKLSDDFDNDGLTLIEEYDYDTNPFLDDSDEDGLKDYDEIALYGTNPINYDTDGDGMGDGTEVFSGLNPLDIDADGDGIIDNCEIVTQQVRLDSMRNYTLSEVDTLPAVELTGCGDYSRQLYAQAIEFDETILDIECLVGTAFEFVHEDDLSFESGQLTFEISQEILDDNEFDDLAIAWYNEELNAIEILETEHNVNEKTISATVEHFSIYMVVSSSNYFVNLGLGDYESILKAGKADIVFVVDTTGSMGTEIANVRNNIEEFVSKLENNNVDVRLGLVEYKDIYEDGRKSTKSYDWYMDVIEFKTQLSNLIITGGGDGPESLVDALACAEGMNFRNGVNKFIIVVTDATYKNGTSDNINATLDEEIDKLKSRGICVSVVTERSYFGTYTLLIEETGGILVDINQNFAIGFMPIIQNIGVETNSGTWVRLSNGNAYKLDVDPRLGDESVDTDGDGLPDLEELDREVTISTYNPATGKRERYQVWTYASNPAKADTDGDGLSDLTDINPLKYDVCVVDLVEDETIKFNTGRVWTYIGCTAYDYWENIFAGAVPSQYPENPISSSEIGKIGERIQKNANYDFTVEELTVIGLFDNEGSKLYMDNVSKGVREKVFVNLTGRESKYYQHSGILWWGDWREVSYGTSGGFFKGVVTTEADVNFTSGIDYELDIYMMIDLAVKIGVLIIAVIVVVEVTTVVAANLHALTYYVKNFGIKQGFEMYKYLGVANVPNGIISLLQMDMSDGDSSLDDWAEKGGANNPKLYLKKALRNQQQNLSANRLKESWIEGNYKYTVRIHEGNAKYTDANVIYRVSRQSTILDANGQGTGLEYLGMDGNWYHQSVLLEYFKGGAANPDFNEYAAQITHIAITGGK